MNFWQRKLLAQLHDPPTKPFNIQQHGEIAEAIIRASGFDPGQIRWFFDRICDHVAAAADRILFPKPSVLRAEFRGDSDSPFLHPLGDGRLVFGDPIDPISAEEKVGACQPVHYAIDRVVDRAFDGFPKRVGRDWANFFLHWRLWPSFAAEAHPGLAFLPADTRVPDHTVWTHCAITSALQGCVEVSEEGPEGELRSFTPAFLLMQIGPVQEFIAQARSTRDLWSGSYLLSYLVANGLKAITDRVGPDAILFPALRGQPLFDFLHKEELYDRVDADGSLWEDLRISCDQILTPNLPNRFLAVVPAGKAPLLAEAAGTEIRKTLEEISQACLDWFAEKGKGLDGTAAARWRQQVDQFLSLHWQIWPWELDLKQALSDFKRLPAGKEGCGLALQQAYDAARKGISAEDLDPRNYRHQSWRDGRDWRSNIVFDREGLPVVENVGFCWSAHYAMADFLLAARRNTRDFPFWGTPQDLRERYGAVKDVLSGKEESIGSEEWQASLVTIPHHLFPRSESLGVMNLIKRVWHDAYLKNKLNKNKLECEPSRHFLFDSVPAVAAADWVEKLKKELENEGRESLANGLDAFGKALDRAEGELDCDYQQYAQAESRPQWIERVTPALFQDLELRREIRERQEAGKESPGLENALGELMKFRREAGAPGRYVAVLALDGDSMGQWLSGAKTPELRDQLSREAVDYFAKEHGAANDPEALRGLLDHPRLLTPSFHLELSTALANFALYLASPVVKLFQGQLIYAGGDDVLAILPAANGLLCASTLRCAFRGDPKLYREFPGVLESPEAQWGFVGIDGNWHGWEREGRFPRGYNMLVPGKRADISAGIAIGHMHSPLQNLVEAARAAEKRAKSSSGYGKSAFSVSLFKRSGEILEWGAKWDCRAIELVHETISLTEEEKLSGRFPYVLADLLRRYESAQEWQSRLDLICSFCSADLEFVTERQSLKGWDSQEKEQFLAGASNYLHCCVEEKRCLNDFLGPFLTAAFLADRRD
ncbi:hypothetical protein MAMC_01881 [Methylacidimicrobium cyclopophantes]|uniref:Uncharacterized protein n=1 Tax=Methylacidimicrobium cyclopophantes TaxID=1041766 RepID=A0A5E6MPI1_9BACT|nr:type III-B CRISPR-associated protein Cas10/Cmr2 [Methylacidimicrobium cyclopophantes]VVM07909.1 hypothetical protein MAMC_01881 [Methylacidimicrobium cyclopophantes]